MPTDEEMRQGLREIKEFMMEFFEHYPDHIEKAVLAVRPDCIYCQKLIGAGKIIQEEGIMDRGLRRIAHSFGNKTYVLVPKTRLGKKVRVSLNE